MGEGMRTPSFNWDSITTRARGLRLNTPDDTAISLESSTKTFFSVYSGGSAPTGESHNQDEFGEEFERGMQPGFRSPTFLVGLSATRQLFHGLTLCADTEYTIFTEKDDFKFGNEFRADLAGVYDLWTKPGVAGLQGILELNLLNVAKDEEGGKGDPQLRRDDPLPLSRGSASISPR